MDLFQTWPRSTVWLTDLLSPTVGKQRHKESNPDNRMLLISSSALIYSITCQIKCTEHIKRSISANKESNIYGLLLLNMYTCKLDTIRDEARRGSHCYKKAVQS